MEEYIRSNRGFLRTFQGCSSRCVSHSLDYFRYVSTLVTPPRSLFFVTQGNGVQAAFEDDPNVLYISIHRYENAAFYPNDTSGSYSSKGKGRGLGLCVLFRSGHPIHSGSFRAFWMSRDPCLTTRLFFFQFG